MLPPAPGRLSMMTCCPQTSYSFMPRNRVTTSLEPPAGNGTTIRTGWSGKVAAATGWPSPVTASAAVTVANENGRNIALLQIIDFSYIIDLTVDASRSQCQILSCLAG